MLFVGTHEHSLDEKGRIVLPAKFRPRFTAEAFVAPAANCIAIYTPEAFAEMVSRLQAQIQEGSVEPKILRRLAASSDEQRLDTQGRLSISNRLREFASLESEALVCGAITHIEIWNPQTWRGMADDLDRSLADAFWEGGGI